MAASKLPELLAGEEGGATKPLFSAEPEGQKFVGGNAKWVDPCKIFFLTLNFFFHQFRKKNIYQYFMAFFKNTNSTLFPWSNGDGEWGVGNIEVVLPSNNPGEEVGDPQAGDVDKRPIWK